MCSAASRLRALFMKPNCPGTGIERFDTPTKSLVALVHHDGKPIIALPEMKAMHGGAQSARMAENHVSGRPTIAPPDRGASYGSTRGKSR